jgi:predicted helicase
VSTHPDGSFDAILAAFREAATSNRDLGDRFERLIAHYLLTDPQYSARFSDVWLWGEWPDRWGPDTGIDLVAREGASGDYWAIQCKFYLPAHTIQKADIDSFFTASGRTFATDQGSFGFANRLIVSTTDKWSKHAEDALKDQGIPTERLRFQDLADAPIDWSTFRLEHIADMARRPPKTLRDHQQEALAAVLDGFGAYDRGKLVMACGTGKTFTSLRIAEAQVPDGGLILFLAPSISLVGQSLREWTAEAETPIHAFAVCSDTKVGKFKGDGDEDVSVHDLAFPATTDPKALAAAVEAVSSTDPMRRIVIFATYQSIAVVAGAQQLGLKAFDLVVCDEAHRTTGVTLEGRTASDFVAVHDDGYLRASKRLYMTATPRIFAEVSKSKADERNAVLYSMDDEDTFGPPFFTLGFDKALARDLLTEYKVLIVAVDEERMDALANDYNRTYKLDDKRAITSAFATRIIGAWKGLSKLDLRIVDDDGNEEQLAEDTAAMRRAVAFSNSIKASRETADAFGTLAEIYARDHADDGGAGMVACHLEHVDGTMNALARQGHLEWLKAHPGEGACRILSNARCLSEGIDVPALDAVVFFDTRDSIVDIVQAVGRVMRRAEGKRYGYIILPVAIPSSKVADYNSYIESNERFKGIWKVLKALRAHDESLVDEAEFRARINVIGGGGGGGNGTGTGGDQGELDLPPVPIDQVRDAVYAAIPKKLGDREYWSNWARDVAPIAERLIGRIRALLKDPEARAAFDAFLKGLRANLNPSVTEAEAIEMLAQHVLTRPVFEALFQGYAFTAENPVSKAMEGVIAHMDAVSVDSETETLEKFYDAIRERVSLAKSDKSRQQVIRNLYDTFFNNAFPRMAERLGIVYTPVELVDFVLHSAEAALRRHFGVGLTDEGVQVLDPFTGTGTFLVRLLQSGLIADADLARKYEHELHANEIVLLAYYIAALNIETAFHGRAGAFVPFPGIALTDTFQMQEGKDLVDAVVLPENSERIAVQRAQTITVIVGNPPYSAQQESEGDDNKNVDYPELDQRIRMSYAAASASKLAKNVYDSYIRAIRWASDRIGPSGVIAFVTNGSFIDHNNMDGVRKTLTEDFSHLYVLNLRGNARTQGEERRKEAGCVFGEGSRTTVAITLLVREPSHCGPCELSYHDIGDYLSREDKLAAVEAFGDINAVPWQRIAPNAHGDWINQRDEAFERFVPLGDKSETPTDAIFGIYSLGVVTNRDPWVYGFSRASVEAKVERMIGVYTQETARYAKACEGLPKAQSPRLESVIDADAKRISWTRSLKASASSQKAIEFKREQVVDSAYRPFNRQWLYFDRRLNEMVNRVPSFFPTPLHANVVISSTGVADRKGYSALVADAVPNMHLTDTSQCFPLYHYEKPDPAADPQSTLFADTEAPDEHGYIRRDAITDWALETFQSHYADETITKEDIFWFVYGVLHSPEYKRRFAANLKKMLPRVPFAADFWAFSKAGRELGQWHLDYETVEPWPMKEERKRLVMEGDDYRVKKMAFGKAGGKPDKTVIIYNHNLVLREIPIEAYEYVVNGKSAIEWVMERYAVTTDKASGIKNDPNDWSEDPRYILDLLKRVVRVSVETVRIVGGLPALGEQLLTAGELAAPEGAHDVRML